MFDIEKGNDEYVLMYHIKLIKEIKIKPNQLTFDYVKQYVR